MVTRFWLEWSANHVIRPDPSAATIHGNRRAARADGRIRKLERQRSPGRTLHAESPVNPITRRVAQVLAHFYDISVDAVDDGIPRRHVGVNRKGVRRKRRSERR